MLTYTYSHHIAETKRSQEQHLFACTVGLKQYELTYHLGNVRATVSDKLMVEEEDQQFPDSKIYTFPNLLSSSTYYPYFDFAQHRFGMRIDALSYSGGDYRFGFNGMEMDPEAQGNNDIYTARYWQYDSRIARRWNIDPVVKPWESSYAAFYSSPIFIVDYNGDDGKVTKDKDNNAVYTGEVFSRSGEIINVTNLSNKEMLASGYTALSGTGTADSGTSFVGKADNSIYRSNVNLWSSLTSTYNSKSGYEYSINDLKLRYTYLQSRLYYHSIKTREQRGMSEPFGSKDWVDYYGTDYYNIYRLTAGTTLSFQFVGAVSSSGPSVSLKGYSLKYNSSIRGNTYYGTNSAKPTAEPNSFYIRLHPKTNAALSKSSYNSVGKIKYQVDFKIHNNGKALSGHGHTFQVPGNYGTRHDHIIPFLVPYRFQSLPKGIKSIQ